MGHQPDPVGAQKCHGSNGDRWTHSPSQFCTPVLRLPFLPIPVYHTHRVAPFLRCPCEVSMSQSHCSTGAPILEIRLSLPPESRHACSPPACSDCHWENNLILAEDAATPEPTGTSGTTCLQDRRAGGKKEVPFHTPSPPHTKKIPSPWPAGWGMLRSTQK